jgi:hypothetical protein
MTYGQGRFVSNIGPYLYYLYKHSHNFKIKNYFVHLHNIGPNTHTLKCRNEDYQYYSNRTQCGLMYGHNGVNNFIAFILERLSLINNNRYTYSMNGIIDS